MDEIKTTILSDDSRFGALKDVSKNQILIIPDNFTSDPKDHVFAASLYTVVKLAKQSNVPVGVFDGGTSPALIEKRSNEWFAPTMFISSLLCTNNPHAVSVALNMISNYLTTVFSGKEDVRVSLDIYVESDKTGKTTKVEYRGPVGGLKNVEGMVKSIQKGEQR